MLKKIIIVLLFSTIGIDSHENMAIVPYNICNPITDAIKANNHMYLKLLLLNSERKELIKNDSSYLRDAILFHNDIETIKFLVDQGADVLCKDSDENNLLHILFYAALDIGKVIYENEGDLYLRTGVNNALIKCDTYEKYLKEYVQPMATYFTKKGVSIGERANGSNPSSIFIGETPLNIAKDNGWDSWFCFSNKIIEINQVVIDGKTRLQRAIETEDAQEIEYCINHGAEYNGEKIDNIYLFHWSCENGHLRAYPKIKFFK